MAAFYHSIIYFSPFEYSCYDSFCPPETVRPVAFPYLKNLHISCSHTFASFFVTLMSLISSVVASTTLSLSLTLSLHLLKCLQTLTIVVWADLLTSPEISSLTNFIKGSSVSLKYPQHNGVSCLSCTWATHWYRYGKTGFFQSIIKSFDSMSFNGNQLCLVTHGGWFIVGTQICNSFNCLQCIFFLFFFKWGWLVGKQAVAYWC